MNGQSEKTEQTTRRESPAKKAEEVSSEDEKEKSRWMFLRKITMGKKGFSTGSDGLGRFKKMMQTKPWATRKPWVIQKSWVCVQGEPISSDRELRMNERWERSILEYKTLF